MSEERQHNTKRELIQRISDVTHIRSDVVQEVLEGLVDVAIEELCSNDGHFRIAELMSVGPEQVKAYENKLGYVPAHKRLRIRLSQLPKIMYKIQQDHFVDAPGTITAENWREVFDHYRDDSHGGYKYVFHDARPLGSAHDSQEQQTSTADPSYLEQPSPTRPAQPDRVPQRVPVESPDRPKPQTRRQRNAPEHPLPTTEPQHHPERTETPTGAQSRPQTKPSAAPKLPRPSAPHNPFLDDDDIE